MFREFLQSSLTTLHREVPEIYGVICERIGSREIHVDMDGEDVALKGDGHSLELGPASDLACVHLRSTRSDLLEVLDGVHTLEDAVLEDRVDLRGEVDDLLAFYDGFITYIHGAVRAPSFPGLLRRYRTATPHESRS